MAARHFGVRRTGRAHVGERESDASDTLRALLDGSGIEDDSSTSAKLKKTSTLALMESASRGDLAGKCWGS